MVNGQDWEARNRSTIRTKTNGRWEHVGVVIVIEGLRENINSGGIFGWPGGEMSQAGALNIKRCV